MRYLVFFGFLLSLAACSSRNLEIDNPTNKAISVSFGEGEAMEIKRYGNKQIQVKSGLVEVFVDGNSIGEHDFSQKGDYLLNPTLSKYYIEEALYGDDQSAIQQKLLKDQGIDLSPYTYETQFFVFGEVIYIGNAKLDSSFMIKDNWQYGVQSDLPSQIKTTGSSKLVRKIYREEYFIEHAEKLFKEAMREIESEKVAE